MRIFEQLESQVRSYIRSFPVIFERSKGAYLYDEQGKAYIDFFAGAGTLNYGHNHPKIIEAMIAYLQNDGILHGLDKATSAKKAFLQTLSETILEPRHMDYKVQFTGPTGTNAIESALKLARMVKGRSNVIAFTNAFHGLTMGSMAVTGNAFYRDEAFVNRANVSFMPFDGYFGEEVDTSLYLRRFLEDGSSGVDLPAAIILETIQAEGGVNVARDEWLRSVEKVCRDFDILLIVDEIQVGNGRTGRFFSFEESGIRPDIITLSKSIGGGLPLALVLLRPELDQWKPGEHTGTFRGNNLAFVAAKEALEYWSDSVLGEWVKHNSAILKEGLEALVQAFPELGMSARGRGLIYGLEIPLSGMAKEVSANCFQKGLVIELAGASDTVLKFLPPLIIEEETLREGLGIIKEAIGEVLREREARMGEVFGDH